MLRKSAALDAYLTVQVGRAYRRAIAFKGKGTETERYEQTCENCVWRTQLCSIFWFLQPKHITNNTFRCHGMISKTGWHDLLFLKNIKIVLKTIKMVSSGQGDHILSQAGPNILSAVCVHSSPHILKTIRTDQLF